MPFMCECKCGNTSKKREKRVVTHACWKVVGNVPDLMVLQDAVVDLLRLPPHCICMLMIYTPLPSFNQLGHRHYSFALCTVLHIYLFHHHATTDECVLQHTLNGSKLSPVLQLQELTSKKEEEDRLKAQQLAERLHRQRENERVRKEREREDRLLARQRDDERQIELQRRLAGVHPEAPSRQERLQRRMKSSQAGSSSDSGGLQAEQSQLNFRSSARLAQQAQHAQHAQQQSSPSLPSHQQDEQDSHQPHRPHHHQQNHQQRQQQQQSVQQGRSRQHAQRDDSPDKANQAESGLLTRLRPRSSRRRTFQETFAWSPLEVPVPQRRRTDLDLRPRKNVAGLVAAAQGLPHCYRRNRRGKWVLYDQVSLPAFGVICHRSSTVRPDAGLCCILYLCLCCVLLIHVCMCTSRCIAGPAHSR